MMKIKVLYDKDNLIYAYAPYEEFGANIIVGEEGLSMGCSEAIIDWDGQLDPCMCTYEEGKLVESQSRIAQVNREAITIRREEECFSVINRGGLWYDLLTEAEKDELLQWYQDWLDAPETGIIPEKPTWLK